MKPPESFWSLPGATLALAQMVPKRIVMDENLRNWASSGSLFLNG